MIKNVNIKNFGSLVDFSNAETPFGGNDAIIHGMNGSGKSQICSIFAEIIKFNKAQLLRREQTNEDKIIAYFSSRLSKEASSSEVRVIIDDYEFVVDAGKQTISQTGTVPNMYVFNENYVDDNVGDVVKFPEQEIRIGRKNIEYDNLLKEMKKIKKALEKVGTEIDKLVVKAQMDSGYSKQKRTRQLITKDNYLKNSNPGENNSDSESILKGLAIAPEPINTHYSIIFPDLQIEESTKSSISEVFSKKYVAPELTREIYKTYVNVKKSFYESGKEIFDKIGTKCPFCLTPKHRDDPILEELFSYLESDYNESKKMLDNFIEDLNAYKKKIEIFVENWNAQIPNIMEKAKLLGLDIDISVLTFPEEEFEKIIARISRKIADMGLTRDELGIEVFIVDEFESLVEEVKAGYGRHIKIIEKINDSIEKLSSRKRELGEQIIKHQMYSLWNNSGLRDRFNELSIELSDKEDKISVLSTQVPNNRTVDFFNKIIKILGIYKYELNNESCVILKLQDDYDISNEGFRISTGERKFIAFSYFLAEVLSSVSDVSELQDITVIIDDPVDSSDYEKFYNFVSVIENYERILRSIYKNDEIELGQFFIFTHNALLFERLVKKEKTDCYILNTKENRTMICCPSGRPSLTTFSSYIKRITDCIKEMECPHDNEMGLFIRRVLEIIASVENINTNKVHNLNSSSKLNALANHLCHDSLERLLDPLSISHQYVEACIELIEEIKDRVPNLYFTIENKYLDGKGIEEYRKIYSNRYLQ